MSSEPLTGPSNGSLVSKRMPFYHLVPKELAPNLRYRQRLLSEARQDEELAADPPTPRGLLLVPKRLRDFDEALAKHNEQIHHVLRTLSGTNIERES